jgi:hypothetical protein
MTGNGDQEGIEPHDPAVNGEPEPIPAPAPPLAAIRAHTFIQRRATVSAPVDLRCDDGRTYVVKARQANRPEVARMMIADHVVGRAGRLLGAPVPDVAFIDVPAELVMAQAELANLIPGIAHGSRFIDNTSERDVLSHVAEPDNRTRFALLAVLYGWAHAADHQFIYEKTPPHRVYSHDHGHFFPPGPQGAPHWSSASLASHHNADLDMALVQGCTLTLEEIDVAIARLRNIVPADIQAVVAGVPADWDITDVERAALIEFLTSRRDALTEHYPAQ